MLNRHRGSTNQTHFAFRRIRHGWVLLVALAWLLGPNAPSVRGQTYLQSPGSPTFSTQIPVENGYIDASNGRLHLVVPMGSFPQRGGGSYNVSLNYDSNYWTSTSGSWQPTNVPAEYSCSNSWSGWRLVTSGQTCVSYTITPTGYCNGLWDKYDVYSNFIWTGPDGTTHAFPTVQTLNQTDTCPATDNPNSQGWASDGSGFWMAVTGYYAATVYAPNGTQVYSLSYHGPEDSNGNIVDGSTLSGGVPGDTLGRLPVTTSVSGSTITYTMANAKGDSSSVYTVHTGTITVGTNFGQSGITEYSGSITVMTDIVLPDGSKYIFNYDSGTGGHYGQLTSMTLPTGGQITYTWNLYTDSYGNKYPWVHTRTTPDSATAWTYSQAIVTSCTTGQIDCKQTFTVQKPNTDKTVYTFALNGGAWAGQIQYYTGASTLVATINQCWKYIGTITSGTCPISAPVTGTPATQVLKVVSSTTLPTPGGSVTKTTQYTPDSYGNYTQIQENNFYSGALPAPDRTTTISYLAGTSYINALILNHPASVTVTNSGGGTITQTLYCYDYAGGCGGSSFASATGTTNHDDTSYGTSKTVRGDLTQVKRLISGTTNYLTTSMTYDMTGQVRTSTDSKGNVTTYSYTNNFFDDSGANPPATHSASAANAYPTTVTPAISSLASTFGYYFGTGQLAKATDPNGNTSYSHFADPFNRPTATSLPNGGWTLTQYDTSGATPPLQIGAETFTGISSGSGTGCSSCRHDETLLDSAGLGRPAKQLLVNDPDGQTEIDTTFDSNGRVKTVSNPYRSGADPTYGLETPTYDGLDRPWELTHADGNIAYTYYGAQITGTLGQTTQQCSGTTYGMGYPVLVVDESGKKRETWTDGFGRVIETDEPNSSGSLPVYTCYSYDLNNNLKGVSSSAASPNQTRSYTYDMVSRITSKTEPETGTTCFYYTTSGGTCGVPASGTLCSGDPSEVCRRVDARGITITYAYDTINRLASKAYTDGTPTAYYTYDQTWALNSLGRLSSRGTYNGSAWVTAANFNYDAAGNITMETEYTNGIYDTKYYTYNLDGSIASITYHSGRTVTYTEGNAQRMTAATDVGNSINYVKAPSGVMYAPTGALGKAIYGYTGSFAGITETYAYNNRLEVTGIQATSSAGTALNLAYSYVSGNNGNIATQTNNVTSGRTQNYTYDSLDRLLTAQTAAISGGDCWGQSFGNGGPPPTMATDALANLFYATATQCSAPQPRFTMNSSNNNQFTGTLISYDSDGDMTADTAYTYTYDAENRLITASGMANGPYCYTYDANGLRAMKAHANGGSCTGTVTVDMMYWRDIAGNTIAETDGSGSTTNASYNEYVFFAGRRIAQSNPSSGSKYYYFVDHLGSTRVVTTATGTPCYEVDYLPYGTENTPSGFSNTCSTHYRFTGYERDSETVQGVSAGNDYAFARYYNSRLERFLSGDPLDGDITDPQTLNKYAYVRDNPANLIDPTGQEGESPWSLSLPNLPFSCSPFDIFGGWGCMAGGGSAPPAPPPLTPSEVTPPEANRAFGDSVPVILESAGTICLFVPVCGEVELGTIGTIGIILGTGAIIHEGVKDGVLKIPPISMSRRKPDLAQVDRIAKDFCVDRNALGNAIHDEKKGGPKGKGGDLTEEEIKNIARRLPKIPGCAPTAE